MKPMDYIKDKIIYIAGHAFLLALSMWILSSFVPGWGMALCIMLGSAYAVHIFISLYIEYHKKKKFYNSLIETIGLLDKKHLVTEMVSPPNFSEGMLVYDMLKSLNKAYLDDIAYYKNLQEEYREYIELWVHEIKTPISSAFLLAQNNKSELTASFTEEIEKIEGYVSQALFYSRSSNVYKDYIVKRISLKELINSVLQKNAKLFISNHVSIETESLDFDVYCDAKWLEYILQQILINSVKYSEIEPKISITANKQGNSVVLNIKDTGIGIAQNELSRIFDKGFTGTNGRRHEKATGMGLYICKKLCDKLGLFISAESRYGEGTEISIVFPKNSLTEVGAG